MADKPSKPGNAMKDLKGLLLILLFIFFLWYLFGGYDKSKDLKSPYLNKVSQNLLS